jgi:2-succinyl-6-hydroxy-2,4-cyclohexadiene-1-carboxylate synthase
VALVHGFTQTSRCWGPLRSALEAAHEVVAIDAPGHGTASAISADLPEAGERTFEAAGPATYVGYSMGGRIVLHTALAHRDHVERLVLISATPGIEDPDARAARRRDDEALADRVLEVGTAAFVSEWLARPMFAGIPPELRCESARAENSADGLAMSLRRCGTGAQEPLWGRLSELAMPTLVVAGSDDARFATIARRMAGLLPAATLAVVDDAGHSAHLERPDAVIDLVTSWLA